MDLDALEQLSTIYMQLNTRETATDKFNNAINRLEEVITKEIDTLLSTEH